MRFNTEFRPLSQFLSRFAVCDQTVHVFSLLKGPKEGPNASSGHVSHSYATCHSDCLFLVLIVQQTHSWRQVFGKEKA